jgi:hypothetical protein
VTFSRVNLQEYLSHARLRYYLACCFVRINIQENVYEFDNLDHAAVSPP